MKIFTYIMVSCFIILFFFTNLVAGLGIAPGYIELDEGSNSFSFKIFNNENLNLEIFFEVQGDDFFILDNDSFIFTSDVTNKIVNVEIKNEEYNLSQHANIIIKEKRIGSSQFNVNLGLYMPVSLIVFEDEAFLDASLNVPLKDAFGLGPYVVSLKNKGLNDAEGELKLIVGGDEVVQSFFIEGKKTESIFLNFNNTFPKGEYDVNLLIDYNDINNNNDNKIIDNNSNNNNKSLNITSKMQSGSPFFNISKLNYLDFQDNVLFFEVVVDSDWPVALNNLNIFATASNNVFESNTFSLNEDNNFKTTIPLFVEVVEDDFILYVGVQNQEPEEYKILIKEGLVYINGEAKLPKQTNILNIILIAFVTFLLCLFIFYELKKNSKKR